MTSLPGLQHVPLSSQEARRSALAMPNSLGRETPRPSAESSHKPGWPLTCTGVSCGLSTAARSYSHRLVWTFKEQLNSSFCLGHPSLWPIADLDYKQRYWDVLPPWNVRASFRKSGPQVHKTTLAVVIGE